MFSRMCGEISYKSNVYCYRMLIFEMIGEKRNYNTKKFYSMFFQLFFSSAIHTAVQPDTTLSPSLSLTRLRPPRQCSLASCLALLLSKLPKLPSTVRKSFLHALPKIVMAGT
ncbi:hypothetical protein Ahy_B01g051916 [Arachis hypogaea]|uniref:Uncharacterized protein n=1 Tax=Arachis hypogaea TaxID=3818 RepID=A0A445AN47_ARAHY|nr:hypothetical protein Ahy_B01g051916 [Arachis hypogaea]